MPPKRKRPPPNPLEIANKKTDEVFIADYLQKCSETPWVTRWTHPSTGDAYTIQLARSRNLGEETLQSCFALIEETSREDYEKSPVKWRPKAKLKEMRSEDLRYVFVEKKAGSEGKGGKGKLGAEDDVDAAPADGDSRAKVRGFTSFMPTWEDGFPVVYCYEIHLKPELQGTGLAQLLMSFLETMARNIAAVEKVMLTCFLANERGLRFYKRMGFVVDDSSPGPRKLRGGKVSNPDYCILSKRVVKPITSDPIPQGPNVTQKVKPS